MTVLSLRLNSSDLEAKFWLYRAVGQYYTFPSGLRRRVRAFNIFLKAGCRLGSVLGFKFNGIPEPQPEGLILFYT